MATIKYIKEDIHPIVYVHNFITDKYLDCIAENVISDIRLLRKGYDLKLLYKHEDFTYELTDVPVDLSKFKISITDKTKPSMSKLDLTSEGFVSYIKDINKDIVNKCNLYSDIRCNLPSSTERVKDVSGNVYSTDVDMLVFNNVIILKYTENQMYSKERDILKRNIVVYPEDSLLLTCVLLGTTYAHAPKDASKKSILHCKNKLEKVKEMLKDYPVFLEYVLYKYNNGF